MQNQEPLYININPNQEVVNVESLCMRCHKQGTTRLMLTLVPFFKEIIVSSFECPHCDFKNNEVQTAGPIQEFGHTLQLQINQISDITRDIVRSEHATIRIPELDFEIPPTKKGQVTTIEGVLTNTFEELSMYQEERKQQMPEQAQQVELFLHKLQKCISGESLPFRFIIEDPSGNSFIKNPQAPKVDPNFTEHKFKRTKEMLAQMGFEEQNQIDQKPEIVNDTFINTQNEITPIQKMQLI